MLRNVQCSPFGLQKVLFWSMFSILTYETRSAGFWL
jgi:hypothetical protein